MTSNSGAVPAKGAPPAKAGDLILLTNLLLWIHLCALTAMEVLATGSIALSLPPYRQAAAKAEPPAKGNQKELPKRSGTRAPTGTPLRTSRSYLTLNAAPVLRVHLPPCQVARPDHQVQLRTVTCNL